jgi:hypothetical protein
MTLPIPITVRLKTALADRFITRELRSLTFRSAVPGGFVSATFSLNRSLAAQPPDIAYYGLIYIYDARTGLTLWEGRVEDMGRTASNDGEIYDLAAVGPSGYAQDKVVPRIWVDSSWERWKRSRFTVPKQGRVDFGEDDGDSDIPSMDLVWPEGSGITTSSEVSAQYRTIYDCGQKLGRVRVTVVDGGTNANRVNRLISRPGPGGSGTVVHSITWSTTPANLIGSRGGANPIPADDATMEIRISSNENVASVSANSWGQFTIPIVVALKKDINGTDLVAGADNANSYMFAHEVIIDMIGRGDLYLYDAASSTIDTSATTHIDQLSYPSGVTPDDVLTALMGFEIAFYWAAWESQANGKYRFEWKPWPTTVRYETDVTDGFSAPGSADELFNQAVVAYLDGFGRERTVTRSATVTELTDAGLTRTTLLDLADKENSLANAQRAGDQALLDHGSVPNAGTLTVARPVLDLLAGRMVQPWEIKPGELIRVRGVQPRQDSLNATVRDGVSVFKVSAMEYDTDSASATLELDSYSRTVANALAALRKRRTLPRRRR